MRTALTSITAIVTVVTIIITLGVFGPTRTASAGPLTDAALTLAKTRTPTRVLAQPSPVSPTRAYTKSGTRRTLEWIGLVGGGIALLVVEQTCDGTRIGEACLGTRTWPAGQIGVTSAIFGSALISKLMPDPNRDRDSRKGQ